MEFLSDILMNPSLMPHGAGEFYLKVTTEGLVIKTANVEETDPTVPNYVKEITMGRLNQWDQAYGWGNHAGLYAPAGNYVIANDSAANAGKYIYLHRTSSSPALYTVQGGTGDIARFIKGTLGETSMVAGMTIENDGSIRNTGSFRSSYSPESVTGLAGSANSILAGLSYIGVSADPNMPNPAGTLLNVKQHNERHFQIYTSLGTEKMYYRNLHSGINKSWHTVATESWVTSQNYALLSHTHDASHIVSGTMADARMSGIYTGMSLKMGSANSVFDFPTGGNISGRTIYGVASYRGNSSNTVGAIVFTSPNTTGLVMYCLEISGYLYSPSQWVNFNVTGYWNGISWSNAKVVNNGTLEVQIRWGSDPTGKNCLIIGNETSPWSFPYFNIVRAQISHVGVSDSTTTGWTSALVTDLTGYTTVNIGFFPIATSVSGSAIRLGTSRNINGALFNGSADITTPIWGVSRSFTIGNTVKSVNGSSDISWNLDDIGAFSKLPNITEYVGILGNGDVNNQKTGVFWANTSVTNRPFDENSTIASFRTRVSASDYGFQISGRGNNYGIRTINGDVWNSWQRIATQEWSAVQFQPIGNYASSLHTHWLSEVTGLQDALNSKQAAGNYLTVDTWQTVTGQKIFDLPLRFNYSVPSADGSGGSGNTIALGISFTQIDSNPLGHYPIEFGNLLTLKTANHRTMQLMSAPEGVLYIRALHTSQVNNWKRVWTNADFTQASFASSTHSHNFADINGKPTTLAGYGITDALRYRGSTPADLNTLESGIWRTQGGLNAPFGATHSTILHVPQQASGIAYGWQLAFNHNPTSPLMAFRTYGTDIAAAAWFRVWHDGNFNPDTKIGQTSGEYIPEVRDDSGVIVFPGTVRLGKWVQTGNQVRIVLSANWSGSIAGSGALRFSLPVMSSGSWDPDAHGSISCSGLRFPAGCSQLVADLSGDFLVVRGSGNEMTSRPMVEISDLSTAGVLTMDITLTRIPTA